MGYTTGRKPWRSEPYQEAPDELKSAKQKLFYFGLVIVVVFGVLTIQLARMQLVNGATYKARAEHNRLRIIPILPQRGLVFDRNGAPLVENKPTYAAAVVAADLPKPQETSITIALQNLINVPAGDIATKVDDRRRSNDPFSPVVVKDDMSQDMAFSLQEKLSQLPGVRVMVEPKRDYVTGPLMAHILGFVRQIDPDDYKQLSSQGYQLSDQIGKAGVEDSYESVLRGTPGTEDVEADASGREIRVLDSKPARPGANLVLSIDLDLQQHVEQYLRAAMGPSKNAAAIVVDVHTGEILAMVSLPAYDDNIFSGAADIGVVNALNSDPGKPMLNHAISEQYAPGSTFKQVTGTAALQEGIANAGTLITSTGKIEVKNEFDPKIVYTFRDWRNDLGTMNFYRGVAMSSDVYFYYLAGGYGSFQGLGADRLATWARRFGLGTPTGIDIPGEASGLVPDPDWKQKTLDEPWTIGDTYNFGIGQGYMTATPIQMAMVTAAVANGGQVLVPHVVKELRDGQGKTIATVPTTVKKTLPVDPRNLDVLREGMRESVQDGAAYEAASKNVVAAGKTGTAEYGEEHADGNYDSHGWFTGFAPFGDPQIAVAVFLENGNGGADAAPLGSKIFTYYFGRQNQATASTPQQATQP